ncbi:MAG TPA: ABC transporter permease [Alphaproteobacteria bacterium]|nr:ABC transporter permease [Alphaproteobacteria bacterium]
MGEFTVSLLTGLSSAAALFLVASGLSIIFGVTRIVNFAHGSFYMLGAYVGYSLVQAIGGTVLGFWAAVLIAAVVVGLIGVAMEMLLLRRIYQAPELFQLIATFGVILVIQDVTLWIWGAEDLVGPQAPGLKGAVMIFGRRLPEYDLALIAASPVVLFGLWLLFYKTRWGTLVRAATQDRQMVAALGVNQRWLFTGVLFLGSALAGLGGAVQIPKGGADLLMDFSIIAAAFVVVVVGGMGSILGAFLAAVLLGVLQTFGIQQIPSSTLVLMFLVMAVVLIFRPWGLLGKPEIAGQVQAGPPEQPLRPALPGVRRLAAIVLAALLLLPVAHLTMPDVIGDFALVLVIEIMIMVLFAGALFFIMGPGGMVSFGHAAFFGGGAYSAALLVKFADAPFEIAFWAAPVGAGLLALLIGWFCVRLSGVYFAMLTLAFAQIAWAVMFQDMPGGVLKMIGITDEVGAPLKVTGGDDGINDIWPSAWASARVVYYYLTVGLSVAGLLFMRRVLYAPFGYMLRAGRDSPLRAAAIGIDLRRHQWFAFTLSGAIAGLAGALFVYSKGSIFPTEMEIARSFDALLMVLLGGVQSLAGPLVGAASFTWLDDSLSGLTLSGMIALARLAIDVVPGTVSIIDPGFAALKAQVGALSIWRFMMGSTIIALVLLLPQGIAGFAMTRPGQRLGLARTEEAVA